MEFVPDVGHQAMLVDVRKLKQGANVVDIVDKALRMGEGHQLKKLENVAKAVNALEDEISALSDEELKGQTAKFKQRLDNGENLDKLMPEAFATVREVSKRTLGQRHFDVQLMGGAALHWGNIAEMKTGEGKTLVATLPSYLNALEGKGVHVVTVNDYLASYQSELMGRIYRFLGMNVGCIITDQKPAERRKQYNADITYGTNNEFGFDYLRDNMAWEKADLVQRGHHYAIVDEVDSILIDEARTPLIISGPAEGDVTRWYRQFARLVPKLTRDEDYEVDEKKKVVGVLDPGITKVEDFLGIDNLYDLIFRTKKEKLAAIVKDVAKRHAKGQPVLLGTASVESSEVVSSLLDVAGIDHQVLNAKQHASEAKVVAVAGRKGAVTVATNMAGRGTDIMLGGNVEFLADQKLKSEGYSPEDTPDEYEKRWPGTLAEVKEQVKDEHEEVVELGGLYVLGTERHESRRIDNQLRGRSGRQGDPGESRFYLSLEDDLMRLFNTQLVARVMAKGMPEGEPIEAKSVSKGVRTAQKTVEARNFEIRKNVLKYDDVMNKQRTVIYSERQAVLKGEDIHGDIERFIADTIDSYIKGAQKGSGKPSDWDWDGLFKALKTVFPFELDQDAAKNAADKLKGDKAVAAVRDSLVDQAREEYAELEEKVGEEGLRQLERRVVLAVLDRKWREHLYEMDYLKDGIGLRGMGQRDPLVEYQREGYQMYNSMIEAIKEESVQLLFHVDVQQVSRSEEAGIESDDAVVDEAEEAVGAASSEVDKAEDAGEAETAEESDEKVAIAQSAKESAAGEATAPITGPAPISHAEGKVPANKRPKNEELKTPWSDGRTFPGTSKNAQCPCGSGRKYKMCHGQNEE